MFIQQSFDVCKGNHFMVLHRLITIFSNILPLIKSPVIEDFKKNRPPYPHARPHKTPPVDQKIFD